MTQGGDTPPGFWERIEQMIDRKVAAYARSGSSRNMSIGEGGVFTIKGGRLRVLFPEAMGGETSVYAGDIVSEVDGTYQGTGLFVQAEDGTDIATFRTNAATGKPIVTLRDAQGNAVLYTSTSTGQGLVRPFAHLPLYPVRPADFNVGTTAGSFETLYAGEIHKERNDLSVGVRHYADVSGTTGEIRCVVDGVQLGATATVSFSGGVSSFGPADIAGTHMQFVYVEVQARRTAGTGTVRVMPLSGISRS